MPTINRSIATHHIRIPEGTGAHIWPEMLNDALEELAGRTGWYEGDKDSVQLSVVMTKMFIEFMRYMNNDSELARLLTSEDSREREIGKLIMEFKGE